MKHLPSVMLISLMVWGCALNATFEPDQSEGIIIFTVYTDIAKVQEVCGKGHSGCYIKDGGIFYIHSLNEWCVLNHELAHVMKGDFHGKDATCKVIPR